jgi:hypothetical protein
MSNPASIPKAYLPAILWMVVISAFSHHQNFETGLSCDFLLKKGAHTVEFGVLALLLYRAQSSTFFAWVQRHAEKAWAWSVFFAVFDECHQAFVPTRTASPRDVVIDSLGAFLALALLRFFSSCPPNPETLPTSSVIAVLKKPEETQKPRRGISAKNRTRSTRRHPIPRDSEKRPLRIGSRKKAPIQRKKRQ